MSGHCPYCFEPFDRRVAFRCAEPGPNCPPEPDTELAEFERQRALPVGHVTEFTIGRFRHAPMTANCDRCAKVTRLLLCVHCHNQLPSQFRSVPGRSIAMVGAKGSGKTHVVGTLIHELQGNVCTRFNREPTLQPVDERTVQRYRADFHRSLYEEQKVITATRTVTANAALRYPLAYQLKVGRERLRALNLVFFDTAGEDLENRDLLDRDARYVASSDAIIALLDPLQYRAVQDQLNGGIPIPDPAPSALELITRVTDAVRIKLELHPRKRIGLPLALVFSKLDAVRGLMDQSSPALRPSGHSGAFDEADAEEVSESIRSHVHEWDGSELENFVTANWSNVKWFGVSALGRPPDGTALSAGVSPVRVEDPILWCLSEWNMIKSRRPA
jgi:hypothetical protein